MSLSTHKPDPSDDELAAVRAGQSTTVEEAMDAETDEDGFVDESAYTPSAADQEEVPGSDDSASSGSTPERPDNVTTLAKVNDSPAVPDELEDAAGEREDSVTVLARVNDNPVGDHDEPR